MYFIITKCDYQEKKTMVGELEIIVSGIITILDSFAFGVCFSLICQTKKKIDTCIIKFCKLYQYWCWYIIFAGFIFWITCLRHSQHSCNGCLIEISILSKFANSFVQDHHLKGSVEKSRMDRWVLTYIRLKLMWDDNRSNLYS